mmetsp:Transcript_55457/g.134653  ORF Transcript_55457/g.134653 Transcript_55457/m.134653 type:complete len:253 (-) Transcript_55457:831-1589(-)
MTAPVRRKIATISQRQTLVPFLWGCVLTFLATYGWRVTQSNEAPPNNTNSKGGIFQGTQYWKEGFTQSVKTLYETRFARFQIHTVKLENGKIVDDWMFFDESNNVNILVEHNDDTFWVLQQKKYGIPEDITLAVVGGLIEPQETPLEAAQRELHEELDLQSNHWVSLGHYQAAANRGGGTTHVFLARQCASIVSKKSSGTDGNVNSNMAVGEAEHQDLVKLSRNELMDAVLQGKFREIKWTATVALALLKTI